ncbi:MAG: alpha-amylase/4-alpha-glucanotransferase domain-containing protein [Candidatus Levyibacteriota bacterium]
MSARVSLLFGVHAHQPADNFREVIDLAFTQCYRPFLETLHRFPDFRFAFHCSGPLFRMLCEEYPSDLQLLEAMVARGQVEILGGGASEPVLAAIPERDRLGQLRTLSRRLASRFGAAPRGAWLTERVWEATVVPALADSGIEYVPVDDYHFLGTGREAHELTGHFTTEEDGRRLDVFPISEALRYRIPFAPAADVVAYLESLADVPATGAAIYFDDIEKFGIWPETFEWVYGRGWLVEFLEGVLASKRIVTRGYGEFRATHRTRGIVYLPSTSYIEMNEWALPCAAATRYAELTQRERDQGRYADVKAFLRGGIWRNFLSLYPEANWMHKRMLELSARLAALPRALEDPATTPLLYAAQANDAYWHGLFGGLYLPHLRRGIYRALVGLECLLDRISARAPRRSADLDLDGVDEVFLTNELLQAVVKDDGRGAIIELDSYLLKQNFGDTLRRHPQVYHRAIAEGSGRDVPVDGIASAHDRIAYRDPIDLADLDPDPGARALFVDRWEADDATTAAVRDYVITDPDSRLPAITLRGVLGGVRVDKRLALRDERADVEWRFSDALAGRWISEIDIAMPSCDGVGGRLIHAGSIRGGFGEVHVLAAAGEMTLEDAELGGAIALTCVPPADVVARPYRTVSQSEQGFEKIMQSVTITLSWALADDLREIAVSLRVAAGSPP